MFRRKIHRAELAPARVDEDCPVRISLCNIIFGYLAPEMWVLIHADYAGHPVGIIRCSGLRLSVLLVILRHRLACTHWPLAGPLIIGGNGYRGWFR